MYNTLCIEIVIVRFFTVPLMSQPPPFFLMLSGQRYHNILLYCGTFSKVLAVLIKQKIIFSFRPLH